MGDRIKQADCEHQVCVTDQLAIVRRWLDELEGSNRHKAYELMQQVMAVQITNEEAFALLESGRVQGT